MSKAIFADLDSKQIKKIAEVCKKSGSIKAADFNRIIGGNQSAPKPKSKTERFKFDCLISSPSPDKIHVLFKGRHYSKNDINSWTLHRKLSYKSAIKKAFSIGALVGRNVFPKTPFEKVSIDVVLNQRVSRDDDSPQETVKIMRDCCTNYGIIKDDNRSVVLETRYFEKLGPDYSVELILTEGKK